MDQNRREFLKGAGIAAAITAMGGLTAGRVNAQFVKTCKIKIGYDDNLGLPNDFAEAIGCEITAYHDLGQMIDAFVKQNLSGLFIPAGALPYIKQYDIVSQAQFGSENKITLKAFFVTTRNIAVQDGANSSIGRVNQYCTTSFWAPLIYLMDFLPRNTSLKFQDTDGFQDMLNKTAEDLIAGSMVWDIILQQNPQSASKVHTLFSKSDLPTPVLIGGPEFPTEIAEKINRFETTDHKAFFTRFQTPDINAINKFKLAMQTAGEFFTIQTG